MRLSTTMISTLVRSRKETEDRRREHDLLVEVARYQVNEAEGGRGRRQCSDATRILRGLSIKDITAVIRCYARAVSQFSRRVSSNNGRAWWQGLSPYGGLDDSWFRLGLHNGLRPSEGGEGGDGQRCEESRLRAWRRVLALSCWGLHNKD